MNPVFDHLRDSVCVVTGGAGTLGSEIALYLAELGVKTAILDHNLIHAETIAHTILQKTGISSQGIEGDVLDKKSLLKALEQIHTSLGNVSFLVNAAGGNSPRATTKDEYVDPASLGDLENSFYGLDLEGFREVFDLNFLGTVIPTMIFTTDMLKSGKGSVVNISSMNSFRPLLRIPAYSAAKASINNFTSWMAVHLARTGIRVNCIAPGFFLTKQNRYLLVNEKNGEITTRGQRVLANTPMARFGQPAEICGSVIFLLSDLSGFITGVTLPIDGGFNAFSGV